MLKNFQFRSFKSVLLQYNRICNICTPNRNNLILRKILSSNLSLSLFFFCFNPNVRKAGQRRLFSGVCRPCLRCVDYFRFLIFGIISPCCVPMTFSCSFICCVLSSYPLICFLKDFFLFPKFFLKKITDRLLP